MDRVVLLIHIMSGTMGLVTGMLNILRKKGDNNHVLVGNLFFYSMLVTGFSALALSLLRPNYFLFVVGTFTLYMVGTGKRYIALERRKQDNAAGWIDWLLTCAMFIAGIFFIYLGVMSLIRSNFFGVVFITFGFFGLFFVREDLKNYKGKTIISNFGMVAHLQRMTGGFIAALTAFLVVNAQLLPDFIPGFVYWLLPTVILTPLIIRWSREYGAKRL